MQISIVIPAKDEELCIPYILKDTLRILRELNLSYEVTVVDDHSKDKTAEVSKELGAIVVENKRPAGKGNALITGFEYSKGEIIIMMDADYSHRAEDIPLFLKVLNENKSVGLVVGSRILGGSYEYTHIRALGNVVLSWLFSIISKKNLWDALNGFKAFRRDVFSRFRFKSQTFDIEIELIFNALRLGYDVKEIASNERARLAGKAKSFVLKHGFKFLWRILTEGISYRLFGGVKR